VTGGFQPAVSLTSGNVFTATGSGAGATIRSYTPQGALRWNSPVFPEQSLSAIDCGPDDTLYVTQDGTWVHALTPTTGDIRWSHFQSGVTHQAPVAGPDERLVLAGGRITSNGQGQVSAVAPTNGALLWKQQLPGDPSLLPAGEAVPTTRPRFSNDGGTAYLAADLLGDEVLSEDEKRSLVFALDTTVNSSTNVPPVVTLTSPVNNARVGKNQTIQLTADVS
jgi:outer membrane protein assembly factor BamB